MAKTDETQTVVPVAPEGPKAPTALAPVADKQTPEKPAEPKQWDRARNIAATIQSYAVIAAFCIGGIWTYTSVQRELSQAQLAKVQTELEEAKLKLSKRGVLRTTMKLSTSLLPDEKRVIVAQSAFRNDGIDDVKIDRSRVTFMLRRLAANDKGGFDAKPLITRSSSTENDPMRIVTVLAGTTAELSFVVPVVEAGFYECSFTYPFANEITHGAIDHIIVH